MRFSNIKLKKWVSLCYFFLGVSCLMSMLYILLFQEDSIHKHLWYSFPLSIVSVLLIFYTTAKYFEFDSDGNVLTFINKGLFVSQFINYREQRAEFPKEKLHRFRIQNYLVYSFLYIYVKSKNNQIKRLRFNISLLSRHKKRKLKTALTKVIAYNKSLKEKTEKK